MKINSLLLVLLVLLLGFTATGQQTIFDELYHPDQVMEVTLQFDCKQIIRKKNKKEELPASITYHLPGGDVVSRTLKVSSRGNSRLKVCSFPPLKLDFSKQELAASGLEKHIDKVKLVSHCIDRERNANILLREFAAYQMYNLLTDNSLRVQLLRITYLDKDGALFARQLGFLVEPLEALALRLEAEESEKRVENTAELDPDIFNNLLLFQYMIGNSDWDIPSLHNVKLLKSKQNAVRILVPYDFDFSGLVGAYYARPQERVGQSYVGERVLSAPFTNEAALQRSAAYFLAKEEAILSVCKNLSQLPEKEQREMEEYLADFFELLASSSLQKSLKFTKS